MQQIETTKATILFVEVPEDARRFSVYKNEHTNNFLLYIEKEAKVVSIPRGTWQFITLLKDAREDQAREIIPAKTAHTYTYEHAWSYDAYPDYEDMELPFKSTALESLHSLANSLGVKGNTAILIQNK